MAGVFGEPLSDANLRRYLRIAIAQETGWTLDYIDGLSLQDTLDCIAVMRAMRDIESFHLNS